MTGSEVKWREKMIPSITQYHSVPPTTTHRDMKIAHELDSVKFDPSNINEIEGDEFISADDAELSVPKSVAISSDAGRQSVPQ